MKKLLAPAAIAALLLTGCGSADEPQDQLTAASSQPESQPTATTDTEAELKHAMEEAVEPAQPKDGLGGAESDFLATYQEELRTLPGGPYEQLGTDEEAIALGEKACADLEVMTRGEALMAYAFDDQHDEAMVADYNAALNAVVGTLC